MEEKSKVRRSAAEKLPADFLKLIFSWSPKDIFDENLYKLKVEDIPHTFDSANDYFQSFIYPLLEETRADLHSSLEVISSAPFTEIKYIKPKGEQIYEITAHQWNNLSVSGNEPYSPSSGDLVILSNIKVETVSDLSRYGCTYVLASITKVKDVDDLVDISSRSNDNGNEEEPILIVRPSCNLGVNNELEHYRYAIFLMNITTNIRIWYSLGLGQGLTPDLHMINKVLSNDSLSANNSCVDCLMHENEILENSFDELNESQKVAVLDSIVTAKCFHRKTVNLIWGPPGTGKTKTLSKLLLSLSNVELRVLTCAPTNVAITEVISRVLKLFQSDSLSKRVTKFRCYRLGDVVLLGNLKRLKIDDVLLDVYLDHRVNRLLQCLSNKSGWRYHMMSLTHFLENCVWKFHHHENFSSTTFVGFVVETFHSLSFPLKTCLVSMCTHLPSSAVSSSLFESMMDVLDLLHSFEKSVTQLEICDKELEEIFSHLVEGRIYNEFDLNPNSKRSNHYYITKLLLCSMKALLRDYSIPEFGLAERQKARIFCLNGASIVFCTVSTSYRLHLEEKDKLSPFNVLIIDEASQLKESESTIPLQLCGIKHVFLIGDECQLSATVKSKISETAGFGRSLFERLSALGHPKHLLKVQYRMHPSISSFPNIAFYSGQILDADNVKSKSYEKSYMAGNIYGPLSFISVEGKEEFDEIGHSRKNMVEVGVVLRIVHNLYKAWCITQQKLSIGIISPYSAQITVIKEKLKKFNMSSDFVVNVKTVDGFQGGEEDIIVISTVRSNSNGKIGFLANRQRTNVALTRARHCLWIIGDGATLGNSNSVWESLVCNAKQRDCFFDANEDKNLEKIIIQVKKELDQMDDLLNKDSVLFRNSLWKVLFSNDFLKSFQSIKSTQLKMSVLNLLLKLASGWRPKKCNVDCTTENSSQLVKQFKIEAMYIICSIDIMKYSNYTQVLKVWDILSLSNIPKLIKRLDSVFLTHSDEYLNRCKVESFDSSNNLVIPKTWDKGFIKYKTLLRDSSSDDINAENNDSRSYIENSKVSESLILMKFYSLTSGAVNHLLTNSEGNEIDLPFEVTDQEREIILFPQSSFILGRSGTGKTTVLTMKLIQKEQLRHISEVGYADSIIGYSGTLCETSNKDESFLRQLFVTVSPKLCSAVKDSVLRLKSFVCGGEYLATSSFAMHDIGDSLNAFKDIPDTFFNIPTQRFPLVITFQKFLIMLDGSFEDSFFERFDDKNELSLKGNGVSRAVALQTLTRNKEVNFSRFTSFYWPHFNARLTKNLDSSIVFTEIISHIKGGCKTNGFDCKLSREDYIKLSETRVSLLNSDTREAIYDIFLDYERQKSLNKEFDLSDLVNDLHSRAKLCSQFVKDQMDFVYIDEVQDLTMQQISLFKYVCKNFSNGFVFAGDTAQTIARGIDFRFQDIRSVFYTEFLCNENSKEGCKSISDMFQLNQNFRTHAGVLKLAQSVIDILYFFFPSTIDRLSPETSLIFGEPPMLLQCAHEENAITTLFGNHVDSTCNNSQSIGFGADQVVLVRDESCKKKITGEIGKQALILTILECKGLEFQDVLLYNFFGDSPLKNNWRVVYEYMNSHNLLDTKASSFRTFEVEKHNILCSELKQLYVAITRTRQRLWICENDVDYSKPMFDYWKKLCVIQVRQVDASITQTMFVASNREEWRDRGIKLFNEGNYEMATMCFEKAGDEFREKWSRASGLRASAERIIHSNSNEGRNLLNEAAQIYENIGKFELAAGCYIDLKNFERAGLIYMEKCGTTRLEEAGDCFSKVKLWSDAAKAYAQGNIYSKCLSVCLSGKLFDTGCIYIESWRNQQLDQSENFNDIECIHMFLEKCALHYHEHNNRKEMMKFVHAFNSITRARSFLKSKGYLEELLSMEVELGNYDKAAELAKLKGDILLEADMLENAGQFEACAKLILFYVIMNSLYTEDQNGWPLKVFKQKQELLNRAKVLSQKIPGCFSERVNAEVSLLLDAEKSIAELAKILASAKNLKIVLAQIFAARRILDIHISCDISKFRFENEINDSPERQLAKMQHNFMSVETLIFIWNIWKEVVCSLTDFLEMYDYQNDYGTSSLLEFCMNYFGVREYDKDNFAVYKPDTLLSISSNQMFPKKVGNHSLINSNQFISFSKSFWTSELIEVGIKVLIILEQHLRSTSPINQAVDALRIFQLSKFLINFQFPHINSVSKSAIFQRLFSFSKEVYINLVFPLNSKFVLNERMVALRGTILSEELLKDVLSDYLNAEFTYGKAGKIAMATMVTQKIDNGLFKRMLDYLKGNVKWAILINNVSSKEPGFEQKVVASSLRDALDTTFQIEWQTEKDYITVPTFVYLLDRLLFMVSTQNSYFYTTKSSFVETLCCSDSCCCLEVEAYGHNFFTGTMHFFASIIHQIILDSRGTAQWIIASQISVPQYYPMLILKLIGMLGIVYMNSGLFLDMLVDILRERNISYLLPQKFRSRLSNISNANFHDFLVAVLDSIGDPLMLVSLTGAYPNFIPATSLFVDCSVVKRREDLMNVIFPKRGLVSPNITQQCSGDEADIVEATKNHDDGTDNVGSSPAMNISEMDSVLLQYEKAYSAARDLLFELVNGSSECTALALKLKAEIEMYLSVALNGIGSFNHSFYDDDSSILSEINLLVDDLLQFSSALNVNNEELVKIIPLLKVVLEKLEKMSLRIKELSDLMLKNEAKISKPNLAIKTEAAKNDLSSEDIVLCNDGVDDDNIPAENATGAATKGPTSSKHQQKKKKKQSKKNNRKKK